jgi:hypothetical protein
MIINFFKKIYKLVNWVNADLVFVKNKNYFQQSTLIKELDNLFQK